MRNHIIFLSLFLVAGFLRAEVASQAENSSAVAPSPASQQVVPKKMTPEMEALWAALQAELAGQQGAEIIVNPQVIDDFLKDMNGHVIRPAWVIERFLEMTLFEWAPVMQQLAKMLKDEPHRYFGVKKELYRQEDYLEQLLSDFEWYRMFLKNTYVMPDTQEFIYYDKPLLGAEKAEYTSLFLFLKSDYEYKYLLHDLYATHFLYTAQALLVFIKQGYSVKNEPDLYKICIKNINFHQRQLWDAFEILKGSTYEPVYTSYMARYNSLVTLLKKEASGKDTRGTGA